MAADEDTKVSKLIGREWIFAIMISIWPFLKPHKRTTSCPIRILCLHYFLHYFPSLLGILWKGSPSPFTWSECHLSKLSHITWLGEAWRLWSGFLKAPPISYRPGGGRRLVLNFQHVLEWRTACQTLRGKACQSIFTSTLGLNLLCMIFLYISLSMLPMTDSPAFPSGYSLHDVSRELYLSSRLQCTKHHQYFMTCSL